MTDPATLPAGRELNAAVAERVFGHLVFTEPRHTNAHDSDTITWESVPDVAGDPWPLSPYSTDISAAFEIVSLFHHYVLAKTKDGHARCTLVVHGQTYESLTRRGDTAPLAICRAALAAVNAK